MTTKRTDHSTDPKPGAGQDSERKTIPASDVGLSLTLSEEALKEFDRIQEKTIRAAEESHKFSWR